MDGGIKKDPDVAKYFAVNQQRERERLQGT